jgi:hypothetical protein
MIGRLGNVLYWAGCGFALVFAVGGLTAAINEKDIVFRLTLLATGIVAALIAWLFGRACRYVLAGT